MTVTPWPLSAASIKIVDESGRQKGPGWPSSGFPLLLCALFLMPVAPRGLVVKHHSGAENQQAHCRCSPDLRPLLWCLHVSTGSSWVCHPSVPSFSDYRPQVSSEWPQTSLTVPRARRGGTEGSTLLYRIPLWAFDLDHLLHFRTLPISAG